MSKTELERVEVLARVRSKQLRFGRCRAGVGLALRSALNAPPFGLRRAALQTRPIDRKNQGCHGPCEIGIIALRASWRDIFG